MSGIRAFESLSGRISCKCTLSGKVSCSGNLSGRISVPNNYNTYNGDYEVVPNAFNAQTLSTANKLLIQDVVVSKVPYYETENLQRGLTVYIAGEEN